MGSSWDFLSKDRDECGVTLFGFGDRGTIASEPWGAKDVCSSASSGHQGRCGFLGMRKGPEAELQSCRIGRSPGGTKECGLSW